MSKKVEQVLDKVDGEDAFLIGKVPASTTTVTTTTLTTTTASANGPSPYPCAPLKFVVGGVLAPQKNANHSNNTLHLTTQYPVILEGLVAVNDYVETMEMVLSIIKGVLRKWYYKQGLIATMIITGFYVFVPLIPGIVLEVKRRNKLHNRIQGYFDFVNAGCRRKGYAWNLDKHTFMINIEFLHPHTIPDHQKYTLHLMSILRTPGMVGTQQSATIGGAQM